MDIEIIGMPTVREADGLAMSSRNAYLKRDERTAALSLSRSLLLAQKLFNGGQRNAAEILKAVTENLGGNPLLQLEYAKICDTKTLNDLQIIDREAVLALAVHVGKTRLIDNYVFGETLEI
jgi:pantoate--beta-alanine ligase